MEHLRRLDRTLKELLFQLGLCDLNLHRLVNLLLVSSLVIGIVLDSGGEERVDEGGLPQARLSSNLDKLLDATRDCKCKIQHRLP
jgi:hypothetical protein